MYFTCSHLILKLRFETCAVVADSGAYTYRTATVTINDLPRGRYLLIPSTFEPGQHTDYVIRLKTSVPVPQPTFLPTEDSGKFVRLLRGEIEAPQSDRMLGGTRYMDNPRYLLQPRQVCWLSLRLRQTKGTPTALNASIYPGMQSVSSENRPIGGTGKYASYVAGVTSVPIKIRPSSSGYFLVISAAAEIGITGDSEISYELSVFSDHPVDISSLSE